MLTSAAAREAILDAMPAFDQERVAPADSGGRVLRQSVVAERDQPPFDRVTMDGIAIRYAEFSGGSRRFKMQATQAAGDSALTLEAGHAIEIMTGAPLPDGADCIVPVERIAITDGIATIETDYAATDRQFIHARGSDYAKDAELLKPGHRIAAADVAVIASCGLVEVEVTRQPAIRVISTGNELVPAGASIEDHQIRLSNSPAIIAMLKQAGYSNCADDHIVDDPALLERRIADHLEVADILVLSGGVSMGKADFLPQVLANLGVNVVFHKVSQRPGKPMWFGIGPQAQAVFALPGNPVSALVCCRQYVIPALASASGDRAMTPEFAGLAQDVRFAPELTCFMPAKVLSNANGQLLALPVQTNTSGDFAALSGTSGYVELALERTEFPTGTIVPLHRWR